MTKKSYRLSCLLLTVLFMISMMSVSVFAAGKKSKFTAHKQATRTTSTVKQKKLSATTIRHIKKDVPSAVTYDKKSLKDGDWFQMDTKDAKDLVISLTHTEDLTSVSYKSSESRVLNLDGTFTKSSEHTAVTLPIKAADSGKTDLIIHFYTVDISDAQNKEAKPVSTITLHGTTGSIVADYSKVDAAISRIPEDLSLYTEESVQELKKAQEAVDRNLTVNEQDTVDGYAEAITKAIDQLKYKPADYSKVDAAIAKAEKLDPDDYQNFDVVTKAIAAVQRDKNITEQDQVDAMAANIEKAIASLIKKDADKTEDPKITGGINSDPTDTDKITKLNTSKRKSKASTTAPKTVTQKINSNKKVSPKTGDSSQTFLFLMLAAGLIAVGSYYRYRKLS